MRRLPLLSALIACGLALAGCTQSSSNNAAPRQSSAPATESKAEEAVLNILAVASLIETFSELEKTFEAAHPNVDVALDLAGSQGLVTQMTANGGADVLATANESTMDKTKGQGLIAEPSVSAKNTLTLIAPSGNPASVIGLNSPLDNVKLVIYAPGVPCSKFTGRLITALGIELHPVPEEQAMTDVHGKVASGEADVGVAYRTDALAEGAEVKAIDIQGVGQAVDTHPIAVITNTIHSGFVQAWVDLVLSTDRQKVLSDAGLTTAAVR